MLGYRHHPIGMHLFVGVKLTVVIKLGKYFEEVFVFHISFILSSLCDRTDLCCCITHLTGRAQKLQWSSRWLQILIILSLRFHFAKLLLWYTVQLKTFTKWNWREFQCIHQTDHRTNTQSQCNQWSINTFKKLYRPTQNNTKCINISTVTPVHIGLHKYTVKNEMRTLYGLFGF